MAHIICLAISYFAAATAASEPVNILHILMDDWGIGDVGVYGNRATTHVKTPSIDGLARDGVLFTNGYSASPVCSPSRTGWMTGRFPAEAAIHTALGGGCQSCAPFLDPVKFPTLPLLLQKEGWRTGHFGKWHLGSSKGNVTSPPPSAYGLDETATFNSDADQPDIPSSKAWPPIIPGCTSPRAPNTTRCNDSHWAAHTSAAIVDKSLAFVDESVKANKPWFINAWFHVSHAALTPTAEQIANFSFTASFEKACRLGAASSGQTTCAHQLMWAAQAHADAEVGRLLHGLRDRNQWTKTLIAFSTDNGPEEPMVFTNGVASANPFRGRKRSLYDGGIRLPFILALPGRGLKGVVDHSVVGSVDWLPTALAIAGVPVPTSMAPHQRGHDISALLLNHSASATNDAVRYTPRPWSKPLLWEWRFGVAGPCVNEAPQLAARVDRYKLLLNPSTTGSPSRVELYDFGAPLDSGSPASNALLFEAQNVAATHAAIVANLSRPLLEWHAQLPPGPVNPHPGCAAINWPSNTVMGAEEGPDNEIIIEDDPKYHL